MLLFVSQANTVLNLDGHVPKEQQINKPKVNGNIFFFLLFYANSGNNQNPKKTKAIKLTNLNLIYRKRTF